MFLDQSWCSCSSSLSAYETPPKKGLTIFFNKRLGYCSIHKIITISPKLSLGSTGQVHFKNHHISSKIDYQNLSPNSYRWSGERQEPPYMRSIIQWISSSRSHWILVLISIDHLCCIRAPLLWTVRFHFIYLTIFGSLLGVWALPEVEGPLVLSKENWEKGQASDQWSQTWHSLFCCCSAWNPNPSGHHRGVSMKTEQSKRNGIKRHESYSVSCNKCMSHGRIHTLDDKYDDFNLLQITGWFSYSFQKIRR